MYIDIRKEDIFVADPTFAMSLDGMSLAPCKDDICFAFSFLNSLSSKEDKMRFYIPAVAIDAGFCLCSRNAVGMFSFTENFESIIRNLTLTVCSVVNKYCRRNVKQVFFNMVERTKNVVRSTAPRFLRL